MIECVLVNGAFTKTQLCRRATRPQMHCHSNLAASVPSLLTFPTSIAKTPSLKVQFALSETSFQRCLHAYLAYQIQRGVQATQRDAQVLQKYRSTIKNWPHHWPQVLAETPCAQLHRAR